MAKKRLNKRQARIEREKRLKRRKKTGNHFYRIAHIGRTWRSCLWNVCYGQDGYDNFE